jgi:hypothetical protein
MGRSDSGTDQIERQEQTRQTCVMYRKDAASPEFLFAKDSQAGAGGGPVLCFIQSERIFIGSSERVHALGPNMRGVRIDFDSITEPVEEDVL